MCACMCVAHVGDASNLATVVFDAVVVVEVDDVVSHLRTVHAKQRARISHKSQNSLPAAASNTHTHTQTQTHTDTDTDTDTHRHTHTHTTQAHIPCSGC